MSSTSNMRVAEGGMTLGIPLAPVGMGWRGGHGWKLAKGTLGNSYCTVNTLFHEELTGVATPA